MADEFPPELKLELDDALQEMRYRISAMQEASGHDAINDALCKHVDGRTVTQVLLLGDEWKLQRLEVERDGLQHVVNTNAQLITKPGDEAAAAELERTRVQQQKRLDTAAAEIQRLQKRVAELGGVPAPRLEGSRPAPLEAASREEALKQIADLIQGRRNGSLLKYGGWPVKIDREGRALDEDMRRDFVTRKTAAEAGGQIVIPIRIKGHWLLFEGPNQAPRLPEFIVANLTAADRAKYERTWVDVDAELWARESGANLELPPPPTLSQPPIDGGADRGAALDLGRASK